MSEPPSVAGGPFFVERWTCPPATAGGSDSRLFDVLFIKVKLVQHAMSDRRQNNPHHRDEENATEECVKRGENLGWLVRQLTHRSHTSQNHRCLEQGINEIKAGNYMISRNP